MFVKLRMIQSIFAVSNLNVFPTVVRHPIEGGTVKVREMTELHLRA